MKAKQPVQGRFGRDGSMIDAVAGTLEMSNFGRRHNMVSDIEIISLQKSIERGS